MIKESVWCQRLNDSCELYICCVELYIKCVGYDFNLVKVDYWIFKDYN